MKKKLLILIISLVSSSLICFSQNNWDGDNGVGNVSYNNNWYGNTFPSSFNSTTDLVFNYNNGGQSSLYYDLGTYYTIRSLYYASTFPSGLTFNGNGNGFLFYFKIENNSNNNQIINIPLSFQGTGFELNAVAGNITFNQPIYNSGNKTGNIYSSNSKSIILSNIVEGSSAVNLTVQNANYGILQINCDMPTLNNSLSFKGGINVNRGELWFNSGSAINGGTLRIGNGDANTCKLYINAPTGGTTITNAISVPTSSTNSYIGGLNTSGTNTYSGTIALLSGVTFENFGGGTVDFQGNITGSSTVNVGRISGTGNSIIKYSTNAKSYTGTTNVNANSTLQLSLANVLPSTNNFTVASSGTLQVSANQTIANLDLSAGGNLTVDAGATLTITGTYSPGAGTINCLGTIVLQGGASQSFPGASTTINNGTSGQLTNLTINNTSGVILNKSLTVAGTLAATAGTLTVGANTLTISGNVPTRSTGNIDASNASATVTFTNASSFTLPSSLFTGNINNLTINGGGIGLGSATTVAGTLTLTSGKLAIGSNTLTLNGTVSGMTAINSLTGSTASNLTVGGSGALGTLYFDQTSNTTKTLNNIIINRTSGTLSLGNSLRLVGQLTPTAGVLTTGGNLRLLSSAIGTSAAIGIGSSLGGYISGTVDVERYSQAQRGYRTFAHPYTSAQSVSQFTDNFQVTGLTSGALGTYGVGGSSNPSAFYYDGTKPAGNAYVLGRITKSDTLAWGVGKGLYVFVRGNGSEGTGGTYSAGINPVTLDVTNANINQGDITVSLTPYAAGQDNFTLVGNPYPCPINLSGVTGINSFGTIYLQNPTYSAGTTTSLRGGFEATSSKNIVIPSMGCFYIQSTSGTPASITFHESDKVASGTSSYALFGTGTATPKVGLEISTSAGFMDRTSVAFDDNASSAATDFYDGTKLTNNLVTFYSLSSERKALGIDYRKTNTTEIIPLGIQTATATNYNISLSELTSLPNTQVVLRDKLLNKETILSQVGDSYSFDITSDTATKGENRFEIGLLGTTVLPVQIADITAQLQANKAVAVNWTSATEVNLASYNVQRSKDGSNFSKVGSVAAKGASTYSYSDDLNTAGILPATIYYRLEAVDKDGSKTFSKVVAVALGSNLAKAAINIYPNPVQATLYAQVTVTKAGAAQLRVVDAQGKVVATQKTQLGVGTTSVSIPAAQLAAGNYVLEIDSADGKQTQRFVKK